MDDLNLNSDEAILQKTQTIIINGVRHEAVLTSRRLIVVASETGRIHEEIPYADIGLAESGVNKLREPIITLTITSPGGEHRTLELIFVRSTGYQNIVELERCIAVLKDQNIPVEGMSPLAIRVQLSRIDRKDAGMLVVEEQANRPAVPEWTIIGPSRNNKQSLEDDEPRELSPLTTITALFIILVVFIIGVALMAQTLHEPPQTLLKNTTSSAVTSVSPSPTSPSPTPTPEPQVTPAPVELLPQSNIPANGVWVQMQYPGNFSGTISTGGTIIEASGSGTKFYQLSVTDPSTIYGSISKLDGSADKMEVNIYKDGTLISRRSTKSPFGVIDLVSTRPEDITNAAATTVVAITPVPIPNIRAPEDFLPQISIPPGGVWVRVYYPGYYSGSIGGRGLFTPIEGTGDQLYEIPANVGIVEGSIEKADASNGKMVAEVYKDGTLISRLETKKPKGLIDLHVPV